MSVPFFAIGMLIGFSLVTGAFWLAGILKEEDRQREALRRRGWLSAPDESGPFDHIMRLPAPR